MTEKELLARFQQYVESSEPQLTSYDMAVIRAGFEKAFHDEEYSQIVRVAGKLPPEALRQDAALQQLYDQAFFLAEDVGGTEGEVVDNGDRLNTPFNPNQIKIQTMPMNVDLLLKRIDQKALDMMPEFQRKAGIWKDAGQSRLIESLLIRIPLPAFYLDATDEDKWVVVDGLQRLTTLKRFVLDKSLKLVGLEFLKEFEGKNFDQLPVKLQRRIVETQITVYLIEEGTPTEVKFNIFKRINTGGVPLSPQEIRHALNQGKVTLLLEDLADSKEFKEATNNGIRDDRMGDRECIIRYFAFKLKSYQEYESRDFDGFLSDQMAQINKMSDSQINGLVADFKRTMKAAHDIFGPDAFRKIYAREQRRLPINKPLFEAWAVNLDRLNESQLKTLKARHVRLTNSFIKLMGDRQFDLAVSQGTGDVNRIRRRFAGIEQIIREVLEDKAAE